MNPRPDYTTLPPQVALDEVVAEVDIRPVPDPDGGIDPDTGFLMRNAG